MVLNNIKLRFKRKNNIYKRVVVIAHRGFSGIAPENTLVAFQKAIDIGSDMIEFDVSLSKDGIPVVIHDKTINRTTNGKGNVESFTVEELKQFDAGSWYKKEFKEEKIPTLEEVIQVTKGKIMLNIEIKKYSVKRNVKLDGIEHKIVQLLEKYNIVNDVLISSFSKLAIQRIKEFNPDISIAYLYRFGIKSRVIKQFDKLGLYSFNQSKRAFSKKSLKDLHEQEIKLNLYTINQKREMIKFIKLGVNGIITNYPNKLLEVIENFENS
jgi:glycerophosphoryl diester phosphodiesterase